jgi:hypothetical protein
MSSLCGVLGSVGIVDGDGHLDHLEGLLAGQELHLRFDREIVRFELVHVEGAGRKSH